MKYSIAILAASFVALLPSTPASGWKETAHRDQLTKMALELVELADVEQKYPDEIWKGYAYPVVLGAHDEDFPAGLGLQNDVPPILLDCRANNHYRHAISGLGLTAAPITSLGDQDVDALTWALTNPYFHPDEEFGQGKKWNFHTLGLKPRDLAWGNMSWERCINRFGYTKDAKTLAYYTLGCILHLLQDMGCPEHVHDDPHGDSGFTGFERYVEKNWHRIKPEIKTLQPKDLIQIHDYFDRLAKIGYSVNRFQGWDAKAGGDPRIDPGSDLAKMFRCHHATFVESALGNPRELRHLGQVHDVWFMENPIESKTILGHDAQRFRWFPEVCRLLPHTHKAHDDLWFAGQFWPTCHEMNGLSIEAEADVPGFFYLELSDDIPHTGAARRFYPAAFLPTPLPEVEAECRGWRVPKVDGKTDMYELMAKSVLPAVIAYSAGLIHHYLALVNHPPYVEEVLVYGDTLNYRAGFEDVLGTRPGTDTIEAVLSREFVVRENKPLEPGQIQITVKFSEPVDAPRIQLAGQVLHASPAEGGRIWSGHVRIPDWGGGQKHLPISIQATDRHAHYGDQGATLDANPVTPAHRGAAGGRYGWRGYEPGADRYHQIRVVRKRPPPDRGWEGTWAITSTHTKGMASGRSWSWSFRVVRQGRGYVVIIGNRRVRAKELGDNGIQWRNEGGGNIAQITLTRDGNRFKGHFVGSHYSNGVKDDDIAGTYVGHRLD